MELPAVPGLPLLLQFILFYFSERSPVVQASLQIYQGCKFVAKGDFELLTQVLRLQVCTTMSGLRRAEDPVQGFTQDRQALYQQSHAPSFPSKALFNSSELKN